MGFRAPQVRRRRGSLGFLVPQTRQTPCPWDLLPNLPGLRERKPFLLTSSPQEPRQHIALERTLPEPREGLRSRQAPLPTGHCGLLPAPKPQAPQQTRPQEGTHRPHTHTQAMTHPAAHKDPVWRGDTRQHGGEHTKTGLAGSKDRGWLGTGQDGHTSPPPRPKGTPPRALQPSGSRSPAQALLSPASPGVYYPAVLTLQPVYYTGQAC